MRFFSFSAALSAAAAAVLLFASTATAVQHAITDREISKPFYGKGSWQLERQIGFAYTRKVDASVVPLQEFYHLRTNEFFYTIDPAEIKQLSPIGSFLSAKTPNRWAEGIPPAYVFPAPGAGRVPLHRFTNGKDWLYSTEQSDAAAAAHGYSYRGVACYLPAGPAVPGQIGPIFHWVKN